jgi:16S rRNA (guanine527-N7)-methyltransferase
VTALKAARSEDRAEFAKAYGVSRETLDRLDIYVAELDRWSSTLNLVSRGTLASVWSRHLADSAQLLALAPTDQGLWADLGSGAGLPGLILAALAAELRPNLSFALVESDTRKAAFIAHTARAMAARVTIHAARIETLSPLEADVISARALAPLDRLADLAARHLAPDGVALFPKGAGVQGELTAAQKRWHMSVRLEPSRAHPSGVIVVARGLSRGQRD